MYPPDKCPLAPSVGGERRPSRDPPLRDLVDQRRHDGPVGPTKRRVYWDGQYDVGGVARGSGY